MTFTTIESITMKKCLLWVLSSLVMNGCVVQEKKTVPISALELPIKKSTIVKNEDECFGKVIIDGVMAQEFVQAEDNISLVYHDAEGNPTDAGPNFLDYRCALNSDNLIVYGHSSRTSELLFTPLVQYLDEDFARNHQEIKVELMDCSMTFHLISVFLFDVSKSSDNDWMQSDFQKSFLFNEAIERLKERSLVRFEERTGSQLLTLVTCNPSNSNERVIVIGIR